MSWCVKVDILGRLCDNNLERSYNPFTTTNIYFIGAAYNSYFLIIYKPLSLIISPQTFSVQLGAGTAWFCLFQCAIPFCTLSPGHSDPLCSVLDIVSQTSFGHISINYSLILTVTTDTESPCKDLSIDTSHISRQSIMAEILDRSTGNHHGTIY